MKKNLPPEVEALLSYFPTIDPPLTLSEEIAYKFSANNKPLPQALVVEYFSKWEKLDEYTELVPCCQLAFEEPFYAIIYWKGSLLRYEYILTTIKESGEVKNSTAFKFEILPDGNIHASQEDNTLD